VTSIDPTAPQSVDALEEMLSEPTPGAVQAMRELRGDLLLLGVGGKMGPTLARMAVRACQQAGVSRRVIGVSRFSSSRIRDRLESWGVETMACDLLQESDAAKLPDVENIVQMTGMKFGTASNPALSWAMNCYVPAVVSRRFPDSRFVVFSSGNVYGLTSVEGGGSVEDDELNPVGEYSITVLGRERMFEYFSRELEIPLVLLRLNYATEMRYGVLVDIAQKVFAEEPIDVGMGYVNVIWQRDANAMTLQSLAHAAVPPVVLNIAGPEILSVREVIAEMARLLQRPVRVTGKEADSAFLSNAGKSHRLFGQPTVSARQLIRWTADWVARGGENLQKPTHFEVRHGKY
jgi:nucleoside-diphosphate-sugar epimerase